MRRKSTVLLMIFISQKAVNKFVANCKLKKLHHSMEFFYDTHHRAASHYEKWYESGNSVSRRENFSPPLLAKRRSLLISHRRRIRPAPLLILKNQKWCWIKFQYWLNSPLEAINYWFLFSRFCAHQPGHTSEEQGSFLWELPKLDFDIFSPCRQCMPMEKSWKNCPLYSVSPRR